MPEESDLLSVLQEPPQGPFAQAGSMLQGYAAGFRGQQNPALLQAQQEQRNRIAVAGVMTAVERERRLKTLAQLEIAKSLWDVAPETALNAYERAGLVKFTPEERQTALAGKNAKDVQTRFETVAGYLEGGLKPEEIPPALLRGLDLLKMQSLPKDILQAVAPGRKKAALENANLAVDLSMKQAEQARNDRIAKGAATPIDLLLAGAKTPEDIGGRLMAQAVTSGTTVPQEYQEFVKAYEKKRRLEGISGPARLALEAALGDPQALQALQLFRDATKPQKLVGEVKGAFMNREGAYAPTDMLIHEAPKQGYFEVTPREEVIVHGLPTMLTMVSQLMLSAKQLRDAGATRTRGGLVGIGEALTIKGKRLIGEPLESGGLLNQWEQQKAELISILRFLGEKGNQAWKGMAPQVEGVTPEKGFAPVIRQLKNLERQLKADVFQSRIPGFVDKIPVRLPDLLELSDPRYQALRARGLTDADIERDGKIIVVR